MYTSEQEAIDKTPVGNWTYYGWWARWPDSEFEAYGPEKLSVGIFQVVAKARGRGKKKTKGVFRVSGWASEREQICADAEAICTRLNDLHVTLPDRAKSIAQVVLDVRRMERKKAANAR